MPVLAQSEYEPEPPLAVGALALDTAAERVGRVMEICGALVFLRPIRGGREWHAAREVVRVLTEREALSAKVADANARSAADLFPRPLPELQPDCDECARLDARRRTARATPDPSAETDARVLLRQHVTQTHGSGA